MVAKLLRVLRHSVKGTTIRKRVAACLLGLNGAEHGNVWPGDALAPGYLFHSLEVHAEIRTSEDVVDINQSVSMHHRVHRADRLHCRWRKPVVRIDEVHIVDALVVGEVQYRAAKTATSLKPKPRPCKRCSSKLSI